MVSLMEWCVDAPPHYLKMPWVTTEFPRYISINGSAVHKQLIGTDVLDFEMCDLLVRRLTQLDTRMEPTSRRLRWRHLLESDFSVRAIAENDLTYFLSIQQQFIGNEITYNMSCTRMVRTQSKVSMFTYTQYVLTHVDLHFQY